jgi:hypothetical protein
LRIEKGRVTMWKGEGDGGELTTPGWGTAWTRFERTAMALTTVRSFIVGTRSLFVRIEKARLYRERQKRVKMQPSAE